MIKTLYYPGCTPQTPNVGLKTEYTYDNMNRLKTLQNKKDNQIISSFTYDYDNNGNITGITSGSITTTYEYDALNRLKTTIKADGSRTSYEYDSMGNRIKTSDNITGNSDTNTKTLGHNEWNELSSITTDDGTSSYTYDPEGLRTTKTEPDNTVTRYHCDYNGRVVAESDANDTETARIIWGMDKPLARKVGSAYYYYIYNGHGDVIALADESGNLVNSYDYDEWGNITSSQEQVANPIKYAGEYFDEESGYYYLRARYYDPSTARFISEDSVEGDINDPLSLNLYTYCINNPMLYIDPSGHIFLQYGNIGLDVEKLQRLLGINVTGVFDQDTLNAVNNFKDKNGLGNTGIWYGAVGDQTWALLQNISWSGSYNNDDSVYYDSSGTIINSKNVERIKINSSGVTDYAGIWDDLERATKDTLISVSDIHGARYIRTELLPRVNINIKASNDVDAALTKVSDTRRYSPSTATSIYNNYNMLKKLLQRLFR